MQKTQLPTLYINPDPMKSSSLISLLSECDLEYIILKDLSDCVGLLLVENPHRLTQSEQKKLSCLLDNEWCLVLFYCSQEPEGLDPSLLGHSSAVYLSDAVYPWQFSLQIQSMRKRLSEQQTKQTYQLLFQQAGLGVAQIDSISGRFMRVNQKYLEIIGYSHHEMTQMSFQDISHAEDLEQDLESMEQLMAGHIQDFSMDKRLIRKNGEIFWVHLTVKAMHIPGKILASHIAIVQDIHQQKMAEIHHKEADMRFRKMFEKHDSIMLLINPQNGRIIDANLSAERFYGYSQAVLSQMRISEINQMDAFSVKTSIQQAYTQEQNTFYFEHLLADGQIRSVEVHSTPIMVKQQELLFSIIHDITSRKQAEKALLKSEARYRQIVETAEEGIWMIDALNMTTFVNQKMAVLLGFKQPIEVIGRSLFEFMDSGSMAYANNNIERRKKGLAETHDFEILRVDGQRVWTSMSTSPIYDMFGVYQGALAMVTDISERKQWETQLQNNLNERELLLREVHHRVKNNFQVIMSMLNLQSRKSKNHSEVKQLLAARERIRSMAIVHESLYHADNIAQLNLADYLKQLVRELFASKPVNRNIDVHFDLSDVFLEINPSISFSLLAYELISNVFLHAFPDHHNISAEFRIKLFRDKDNIYLEVYDNGVGFSRLIFDEGNETLGFQLVKQFTRQLDATLELKSDSGTWWYVMSPFKTVS